MRESLHQSGTQQCGACKRQVALDDFSPSYRGTPGTWCRECFAAYHRGHLVHNANQPCICMWCGERYVPVQLKAGGKFCSRGCKYKARNAALQQAINLAKGERFCLHCGGAFPQTMRRDAIYCSAQCNDAAHAITRKIAKRAGTLRDKAPLSRAFIGDRDGWRCGICGGKVNPALRHPNPLAPSVDHILPLARGGSNDPANLQMSHLRCNLSKRARME